MSVRRATILLQRMLLEKTEMSCEMMADEIITILQGENWMPSRVTVDEDGECGADVEVL